MSSIVLGQFDVGAIFPVAVDDGALGPGGGKQSDCCLPAAMLQF